MEFNVAPGIFHPFATIWGYFRSKHSGNTRSLLNYLFDLWIHLIRELHRKLGIIEDPTENMDTAGPQGFRRVVFPETDKAEWLNKIILQFWPFLGDFMQDILKKNVEPKVKEAVLSSFTFSKVDMGTKPLRIEGVRVYSIREGEVYMDMDVNYVSDADIDVGMLGMDNAAGIRKITLKGTLRVVLKPLLSTAPLIGGISFYFITNPMLEFDLTNLANIMDIPMFKDKLQAIIQGQLSNMLVFPRRMEYVMGQEPKFTKIHCARPQGVLTVHVLEASDLRDADILGQDSDPYTIVTVGDQTFQTDTIDNKKNPTWNQSFDALVDLAEEHLDVTVMDKDKVSGDDSLGKTQVDIARVIKAGTVDEWLKLEGVKQGSIRLKLTWFYLANDPSLIAAVQVGCPKCLLLLCVQSAEGLVQDQQKAEELSPVVSLSFKGQEFTTTPATSATSPLWEEDYRFIITCPKEHTLALKVKDTKTDAVYGTVDVAISDLIGAPDMTIDQSYPLVTKVKDISPKLRLQMVLRVFASDSDSRWLADSFQ